MVTLGAERTCVWASLLETRPLNLVLNMPLKMFAYSSNIFRASLDRASLDLMVSMPACETLKYARLLWRSFSFSDHAADMKLFLAHQGAGSLAQILRKRIELLCMNVCMYVYIYAYDGD